jgi:hypothetical protein
MNLGEYIKWAKEIDEYQHSPELCDPGAWGFKNFGKVKLPKFKIDDSPTTGGQGYSSIRNPMLVKWAKYTWPFLDFVESKIQIQFPGQECKPHLDLLNDYLENVCAELPVLKLRQHSLQKPGVDVYRMFVAMDDQIPGQRFIINGQDWHWTAGDCIRLNNWQALHSTINNSVTPRSLIKITGIVGG